MRDAVSISRRSTKSASADCSHCWIESATAPVWLLSIWMIVLGTIFPFALSLGALHHLPATRVSIVAMVEVVLASVVAWVWLEETLSAAQLAGGAVVLTGIVLAQTSR